MDTEPQVPSPRINPERIRRSASYRAALARSAKVLKKPEKLTRLVNDAMAKASGLERGPISDAKDNLFALFRLLGHYARGSYREVSWSNLVLVVSAIVYFVTPVDLIPDIITGLGYLDDAALLTWTVSVMGHELEKFQEWEVREMDSAAVAGEMAEE